MSNDEQQKITFSPSVTFKWKCRHCGYNVWEHETDRFDPETLYPCPVQLKEKYRDDTCKSE